jgi:hypothetical protein
MLNIINLKCGIVTARIKTALVLVYWFLLPLNTSIRVQFYLLFRFILSFNTSVFVNWAWYIHIVTVYEGKYIMVVMHLSVSIDCSFLIVTFSSVCIIYYMIKNVHIYVKNCFLSTHISLKSPVFAVI